uniref:Arrestin domain containing 3a n=1 Tax=Callorhinchus milii TaxID=7868 RepID=A0A4W3JE45_CALMI
MGQGGHEASQCLLGNGNGRVGRFENDGRRGVFHWGKREREGASGPKLEMVSGWMKSPAIRMQPVGHLPLPATFKGLYGKVEYTVEAKLNRPWKLSFSVEQPLPVFERIDINHPLLLLPHEDSKDKVLSGWCCTSGVISLNVKIRRKGYTQGEEIQIFAEFENGSSREVVPKAVIHQTQTFFAQGKSRKIQETIAKIDGEPVAPGQTGKWIGKGMLIPTLPPSYLSCRIITMEYTLMVSCFLALLVNLPLVIGTIALHPSYYSGGEQPEMLA